MMKSTASKFTVLFLALGLSSFWFANLITHSPPVPTDVWFIFSSVSLGVGAAGSGLFAIGAWVLESDR